MFITSFFLGHRIRTIKLKINSGEVNRATQVLDNTLNMIEEVDDDKKLVDENTLAIIAQEFEMAFYNLVCGSKSVALSSMESAGKMLQKHIMAKEIMAKRLSDVDSDDICLGTLSNVPYDIRIVLANLL